MANKREVVQQTSAFVHEIQTPHQAYTGDVTVTLERFREQVQFQPNAPLVYSALDALCLHPTWANNRGYRVPLHGEYAEPSGTHDSKERVVTATRAERTEKGKKPTETNTTSEVVHRKGNLRAHAKSMAMRIVSSTARLVSFFEAGMSNMRWTTAVARAIQTHSQWKDQSWDVVKGHRALIQLGQREMKSFLKTPRRRTS